MLERADNFLQTFFSNRNTTVSKISSMLSIFKQETSADAATLNNYRRSKNVLYDDVCM